MTTREAVERSIRKSASLYLDEYWQEGWGDVSRAEFESMVSDFTEHVSAAIDDCFHDYLEEKERMNVGFTTPSAGGSRRDSSLSAVVEVPVAKEGRDA